jgi:D-alanyl-D-alanine carboxypeptidase/D-alanyl-D-alanine-endopeptidase (penicillin-binding protein 4)
MKRKPGVPSQLTFCFLMLFAAWSVVGEARLQSLHATQQAGGTRGEAPEKKTGERFTERAESLVSAVPVNKGEWGLLVVGAATGETLYEKNADRYFTPASNMKLLTTALALDKLGPGFRFRTTVETHGAIAHGVLSGDLILVGRGDPNLSNRKFPFDVKEEFDGPPEKVLIELADQVVARGVKEISGDIVGDDSYFPRDRYPDGWEIDDMVWEYGAAISAIVLDDNTVTLTLTPGEKAGDRTVEVVEPATPDFAVQNGVTTSDKAEKADLTLVREPGSTMVVLSGALPLGDTLKLVNKISQNLHTEVLLRTAARQQGRWAKPDDLLKFPEEFYAKAGIAPGDVVQEDGSGMSRHDLVTPRALVALLLYAQKQSWFPAYFNSLPVAGIDGTLNDRMKKAGMMGRIHAKTGSIAHVQTLSGFADTPGGRRLIFSFLSNNQSVQDHEVHDALDGLCMAMVEEFDVKK